ncbi:uncharacterized protein IL334_007898 [Kwoniella shivajii]|uniref:Aminotransferase class V domain-containing protein n=1 Tax=Kwoniella shivajii TaxID=564305 RepID=A0ABZ1D9Z6_9TREE|nr:hypothetical protein IL334_007898 [Kwoniella shivajii]
MPTKSDTIVSPKEPRYDFFFYGTLCVPAVLVRVLGHKCDDLTFQDALLPNYTRHCVKDESYPAIIDRENTNTLASRGDILTSEEVNVRGTLVKGLTYADVNALDIYEGIEYTREKVVIQALTAPSSIPSLSKAISDPTSRVALDNLEAEKTVNKIRPGAGTQSTFGIAKEKFLDAISGSDKEDGEDSPKEVEGAVDVGITEAWTYIWSDSLDRLEPSIWSFESYMKAKESAWKDLPEDYFSEVERQRALKEEPGASGEGVSSAVGSFDPHADGEESKIIGRTAKGYPDFGREMRKHWGFNKDYVNLNHGSYGSPPKVVIEKMRTLSDQIEQNPDLFMRRSWLPKLNKVRQEVSEMIGARLEEVVMVPNTTHGVNTILANLEWAEGDIILIYSTTYGAVGQMVKCVCDRNPQIRLEVINDIFPCTHQEILDKTNQVLGKYNQIARPNYTGQSKATGISANERVRAVIVDAIASNPGVVYPWEEIVRTCKKYGAMSIVDAAHAIGQVEVDLKKADCDFWVSNCHKWLHSHRGGAVLYVPIRNQYMMRSTFPTSAGYESSRYPTEGMSRPWSFVEQFQWTGTTDWTPLMSITDALEFRRSIGGEKRIMQYCHTLAIQGGKRLRKRWGTEIMENSKGELTAAMVNVQLPHVPDPKDLEDQFKQLRYMEDKCFANNTFAAAFRHGGKWWARFSAQVWNDLGDFDYAADVLEKICLEVKQGKYLDKPLDSDIVEEESRELPAEAS